MLSQNPDRAVRGEPAAVRRRIAGRAILAGLTATLSVVVLGSALAGQRTGQRAIVQDTTRQAGSPPGDLRCLTRRAEDCLDTPVPADEPHGAVCATCHTLWQRDTPAGAIKSCSASGCHEQPATLSPFHETVGADVLEDCTACHVAHSFRVPDRQADCYLCHTGGGQAARQAAGPPPRLLSADLPFTHSGHEDLGCVACHTSRAEHGRVNVAAFSDCQSCHHSPAVSTDCVRCHEPEETNALSFPVTRTLDITIGSLQRPSRTLRFEHSAHDGVACGTCHTGADLTVPVSSDCSSCHLDHHEPAADCSVCHERPVDGAHTRDSHLGCAGSTCHVNLPAAIDASPMTRSLCLACHTDLRDHMPDRDCAACHFPAGQPKKSANGDGSR